MRNLLTAGPDAWNRTPDGPAAGKAACRATDVADPTRRAGAVRAEAAVRAFRDELDQGYFAMVSTGEGQAEQVRELPLDAELVIMRLPISGG